jgi:3-isopropylmalate/(R)-2-methylmalate dehydratase small subunit
MEPFTTLTAVAAPLDLANIDTDRLLPARFLKRARGADYARFLFHDLRFDAGGAEITDFVLNRAPYRQARILVADANFGTGSSREGAVWALDAFGVRAVIAVSFGDIFSGNAIKNGLLPIRLDTASVTALRRRLHEKPGAEIAIDLARQTVTSDAGISHRFEIAPSDKRRLLEGLDDIGVTLTHRPEITHFEAAYATARSWARITRPSEKMS